MKNLTAAMQAHLASEQTTLATCWKVTRRDGVVIAVTDHERDIDYDGNSYIAASGFSPSALTSSSALNVDNLEIEGLLSAEMIAEQDLLSGLYDYAEVEVFIVNYEDTSMGRIFLRRGWIGQIQVQGGQFIAELRSLSQQLNTAIGEHYTPGCRADLGDSRCKIDLAAFTVTGSVTQSDGRHGFTDSSRSEEDAYFAGGSVTFTSGANAGRSVEVKRFSGGAFTLALPLPQALSPSDSYSAIAGCDKRFETCINRFNNAVNFRGEPHVPGTDKLLETATTRNL